MDWKTIEQIAKNSDKKWVYAQAEVADLLSIDRHEAARFLQEQSVPYYRIGERKKYFLPEILEAVERTRWKEASR